MEKPWSKEEAELVWKLVKVDGLSHRDASAILYQRFGIQRSRNAIAGRINRMGGSVSIQTIRERLKVHRRSPPKAEKEKTPGRVPKLQIAAPEFNGESTPEEQRTVTGCRYIHGEVMRFGEGDWRYCNHPTRDGMSYCEYHDRVCVKERKVVICTVR